nr:hypothetical protein [Tanacetum cinerariifolium]
RRVKKLERRNKVRKLKLRRLQRVGTSQRVETFDDIIMDNVSNQGRMIAEVDADDDVVLEDDKEVANEAKEVAEEGDADENVEEVNAGDATEGDVSAAHGEVPTFQGYFTLFFYFKSYIVEHLIQSEPCKWISSLN